MIQQHIRDQTTWLEEVEEVRLSKSEYNRLIKTSLMNEQLLTNNNISSDDCSICQEKIINGDYCAITPCNHLYHSNCSVEWFINHCIKPTCPICRKDVREE